jgi:hypothetical protein
MNKNQKKWLSGIMTAIACGIIAGLIYNLVKPVPNSDSGVISGDNITSTAGNINIAGGDRQIIQGIDQRDLAKHLKNFKSTNTQERKKEIQNWYTQKQIDANMKEALFIVVDKIDAELKASRKILKELKAQGKNLK